MPRRASRGSVQISAQATGVKPDLNDAGVKSRVAGLRAARARQHARSVYHWNAALRGLEAECASKPALRAELEDLKIRAGFGADPEDPSQPEAYTRWTLQSVAPGVSTRGAPCRRFDRSRPCRPTRRSSRWRPRTSSAARRTPGAVGGGRSQ